MIAEVAVLNEDVLGFRVGAWGFVLPVSIQCEVLERLQVNPIPNVEPWLSGLLNVRGQIVPVIDLRLLLGDNSPPHKQRYLFAIDRGDKSVAIWIDGYPQLLTTTAQSCQALGSLTTLSERLQPFLVQAYRYQDQLWLQMRFDLLFKSLGQQQARQDTVL